MPETQSKDSETLIIAPLWRRLTSIVYDAFPLFALGMLYGGLTQLIDVALNGQGELNYDVKVQGLWFQLGFLGTILGFYIFFWLRAGQTVGMRAWGLVVKHSDAKPLTFTGALLRAPLAAAGLLLAGIGYWWCLIDTRGDALQDRLSKTRVFFIPKEKR